MPVKLPTLEELRRKTMMPGVASASEQMGLGRELRAGEYVGFATPRGGAGRFNMTTNVPGLPGRPAGSQEMRPAAVPQMPRPLVPGMGGSVTPSQVGALRGMQERMGASRMAPVATRTAAGEPQDVYARQIAGLESKIAKAERRGDYRTATSYQTRLNNLLTKQEAVAAKRDIATAGIESKEGMLTQKLEAQQQQAQALADSKVTLQNVMQEHRKEIQAATTEAQKDMLRDRLTASADMLTKRLQAKEDAAIRDNDWKSAYGFSLQQREFEHEVRMESAETERTVTGKTEGGEPAEITTTTRKDVPPAAAAGGPDLNDNGIADEDEAAAIEADRLVSSTNSAEIAKGQRMMAVLERDYAKTLITQFIANNKKAAAAAR